MQIGSSWTCIIHHRGDRRGGGEEEKGIERWEGEREREGRREGRKMSSTS